MCAAHVPPPFKTSNLRSGHASRRRLEVNSAARYTLLARVRHVAARRRRRDARPSSGAERRAPQRENAVNYAPVEFVAAAAAVSSDLPRPICLCVAGAGAYLGAAQIER